MTVSYYVPLVFDDRESPLGPLLVGAQTEFLGEVGDVRIVYAYCCVWDSLVVEKETSFVSIWRPPSLWVDGKQIVELDGAGHDVTFSGGS